jgi:glycosyltransferase involved in cell wall biosynthesis
VGGGPWEQECLRVARAEGVAERVHITGYVEREHVFDWASEADVFAFSSLTDTQGVAVLEAMALGVPAVAVRSGAVEDVIRDGVDGLIVDPTAEALAEGLGRLLADSDLRERLAGQARQRAEEFSAGRMTEKLVRVYERALAGQTPGSAGR